jgi:hypothetical protein
MNSFAIFGSQRNSYRNPSLIVGSVFWFIFMGLGTLYAQKLDSIVPLCLTPPTATWTPTKTFTPSSTPTFTNTSTFSFTPTASWTWTETFTWTSTATDTPSLTPTFTHTPSATSTLSPTSIPTQTLTPTATVQLFSGWPDDFYFSKPYPNPNHEVEGVHFDYRLPPNVLRLWLTVYTINGDPIFKEMFLGPGPGSYRYVLNWSQVPERWANGVYFFVWRAQHNSAEQRFIFKVMILR